MLFLSSIKGSIKTLEIRGVMHGYINKIVYCLDTLQIKGLIKPPNKFVSVVKCKSEILEKCKKLGIKLRSENIKMTSVTYESVLNEALEASSCDINILEVMFIKDELNTLMLLSDKSWAPLKATIASIVAKLVHPDWDTRKHQTQIGGNFSLRSIDNSHISRTLFQKGLYDTATSFALTRSFEKAEPFDKSYTGKITPVACKDAFLKVVEVINTIATTEVLKAMLIVVMQFLKERKTKHIELKETVLKSSKDLTLEDVSDTLQKINKLSGRGLSVVPVIIVHTLVTIIQPYLWPSMTVKPLKEHTAPDGHTESYGDIEGFNTLYKPVMAIEIKDKIKVDDTIITTFNKKTVNLDIPLKYILTTANISKYNSKNNVSVQTVLDFIITYLQLTLYHNPSICTFFVSELQKCLLAHTNLSLSNKEAVNTILISLLA